MYRDMSYFWLPFVSMTGSGELLELLVCSRNNPGRHKPGNDKGRQSGQNVQQSGGRRYVCGAVARFRLVATLPPASDHPQGTPHLQRLPL